jgi:hypothetical protein
MSRQLPGLTNVTTWMEIGAGSFMLSQMRYTSILRPFPPVLLLIDRTGQGRER